MYERNAIVLQRYFEDLFGFKISDNIKQNYKNYRVLIEKYEKYTLATDAENNAVAEFKQTSNDIAQLQKKQEILYNKSAKLEYSRYIMFNNIEEKPEQIEKCLNKVASSISETINELNDLDKKFVNKVIEYNEKKSIMEKCIEENQVAKYDFESILDETRICYENILEEKIEIARNFINSENKNIRKELVNIFTENGKNERNPFDADVILNAVNLSMDIYKIEIENYLLGVERTGKFFEENEDNSVKLAKHKKFYNDSKIKIDFVFAEKEYLVQFLDNERIAAIYNQKVHRKLMLEACRNFKEDLQQINNLYEIILKEIAGRSTKRIYKENYNKEYLIRMEQNMANTDIDSPNIRANSVALMNFNYWRIEGIKKIYEAFDKDIVEIYNKDLLELVGENQFWDNDYDIQESSYLVGEEREESNDELDDFAYESQDDYSMNDNSFSGFINSYKSENNLLKNRKKYGVLKSSKQALANAIYISLQTHEFSKKKNINRDFVIEEPKANVDYELDIERKMQSLDWDNESNGQNVNDKKITESKEMEYNIDELMKKFDKIEETQKNLYKSEEDDVFDLYFEQQNEDTKKRKARDEKKLNDDLKKSTGLLKRIININSKKRREA